MGSPSSPGFYLSRVVALLLAGLVAALLLALAVLAALFGHCARTALSEPKVLGVPGSASSPPSRQEETRPTLKYGSAQERVAMTPSNEWRPPGPWDQLRLPSWVVPLHYDLELWPRLQPDALPEPGLRFSGCVNITVRCTAATTRLLLHSLFLDYDLVEVFGPLPPGTRGTSVGRVQVNHMWFALDTQYMVLELGEALQPGSRYELRPDFSGPVFVDAREGLFLNVYTDQGKRRNNYIGIETALDLTKYLAEEDEIIVWRAVLVNLVTSDLVSDASNYDMYPLLKKYLLKRIKSIWTVYSTIIRENVMVLQDDYLALISLEKLFGTACWLGLEDCLGLSRELFRKWMTHPQDEIPCPIKTVTLCYGIALGSDEEWDFLFSAYVNNTVEEERLQFAYALSCSKDPWILNRYLEYAITTSPLAFNETNVIETVAASEVGRYIAKDFLINHWQAVSERYGAQSLIALMYTIGRTISTDAQITELQQFFSDMLEEPQRLTVHAKLQTIKNENLENRQRSARIAAWLRKHT